MPARDPQQFSAVAARDIGHLAQPEVDTFGEDHVQQADPIATRRSGAEMSEVGVINVRCPHFNLDGKRENFPFISISSNCPSSARFSLSAFRDAQHIHAPYFL